MKLGVTLRNMGPQSRPEILRAAAVRADELGIESLWITDHIAIPPDDAEGSGGRYTDPLVTLAWLGGMTDQIRLGTGVLILPYRPPLPTAKQVATLHELTGERLLLGVGIGWMDAEFRALGVDRHQRGRISDDTLAFLRSCFEEPVVSAHGQDFLFDPRPPVPPVYVGGRAPHALARALRFGHGWLPMVRSPERLAPDLEVFREMAAAVGVQPGPVTAMTGLPLDDHAAAVDLASQFAELGVERLACGLRYDTEEEVLARLEQVATLAEALPGS